MMQAYKTSVKQLLPSWASAMEDPQEATAERHLGELQFNIEATFGSTTPWKNQIVY